MSREGSNRTWRERLHRPGRGPLVLGALAWTALGLAYLLARITGAPDRLSATFWTNAEWSGAPALTRTEDAIRTDREDLERLLGDAEGYSAEWNAVLYAPRSGEYRFAITSDDGSWVFLDGAMVIDNGGRHGAETRGVRLRLTKGNHALKVRYFDAGGVGVVKFSWMASGLIARAFPSGVLYPSPDAAGHAGTDWAIALARDVLGAALLVATVVALVAGARLGRERPKMEAVLVALLFAALLGLYGARLFARRSTAVTACDSYAYLQGAVRMEAQGPLHSELHDPLIPKIVEGFRSKPSDRDLVFLLSPHGHYVRDLGAGVVSNVFPPGLMWLLLPFVAAGGTSWALLVLPLLTVAFAVAFFVVGLRRLGPWAAASAAIFLVCNPVVFENTVLLMSDVPSMVLTAACAYLLYLNLVKPRAWLPALAGACFGAALTVRYSNAAAIVPVMALFAAGWAGRRDLPRLVGDLTLFGGSGTVLGLLPLALYTNAQFGTPWRLTYDPYTATWMSTRFFLPNLGFYARGLISTFGVPVLLVIVTGIAASLAARERRLLAVVGLLVFSAFFFPYAFERMHEHRYLMPTYPWLAVFYGLGALAIGGVFRRVAVVRTLVLAVLVAAPLLAGWHRLPGGTVLRDRTSRLLAQRVGEDAVVFCDDLSGPVRLYGSLTGYRFVWTTPEVLRETCDTLARLGRKVFFVLDRDSAKERFASLRQEGVLGDRIVFEGDVDGYPLWRLGPP